MMTVEERAKHALQIAEKMWRIEISGDPEMVAYWRELRRVLIDLVHYETDLIRFVEYIEANSRHGPEIPSR